MKTPVHTIAAPKTDSRSGFAAPLAVAAALALGGSLCATGNAQAQAQVCARIANGFEICIGPGNGGIAPVVAPTPQEKYIQTIGVTTHIGSGESLVQTFKPNTTRSGQTRVCLNNRRGGQRRLAHNYGRGINTLSARPGGQSCANFPSNARVTFTPYTGNNKARPAKTLVYNLSAYAGGLLRLTWQ